QEVSLCDWILEQDTCGYAPSYVRAREMAALMLKLAETINPLRKKWIFSFVRHHP
ncbi:hypothetical protein C7212DRAFT_216031, partial [Tuber magnatum]